MNYSQFPLQAFPRFNNKFTASFQQVNSKHRLLHIKKKTKIPIKR